MKKKRFFIILIIILTVLILSILSFMIGTGFVERTDVVLIDYSVSKDGTKLKIKTAIPASMGYIRGFKDEGGGMEPHYLTFYSTFGGLNSSLGAKQEFELDMSEDEGGEIYFNRPQNGYELVLKKNIESGEWELPVE